jgi:hypothetical protein
MLGNRFGMENFQKPGARPGFQLVGAHLDDHLQFLDGMLARGDGMVQERTFR